MIASAITVTTLTLIGLPRYTDTDIDTDIDTDHYRFVFITRDIVFFLLSSPLALLFASPSFSSHQIAR